MCIFIGLLSRGSADHCPDIRETEAAARETGADVGIGSKALWLCSGVSLNEWFVM